MADSSQNQSQLAAGAMQRPVPVQQGRTMTTLHESSSGPDSPNSSSSSMSGRERRRFGKLKQQQRLDAARGRIHALEAQVACLRAIIAQLQERSLKDGHDMVVNTGNPVTFDLYASEVSDASIQTEISVCHSYPDIFVSPQQVALSSGGDAAAGAVMPAGVGSFGCKDFISHSLAHEPKALPGGEAVASPAPGSVSVHEACTPGSSNPGAQNGAADFCLYNAGNKVSSYFEGLYDTRKTACAERQCGHGATATDEPDAQPVLFDAIGDYMSEEPVENLKDSNSQHLGKLALSSYEPLPTEVIAEFNSQGTMSKCDFSSGTPGSSNPGAQDGAEEFRLYNAALKVSSYSEGHYDTGKTALPERQCGHVATARHNIGDIAVEFGHSVSGTTQCEVQGAQPVLLDAIGDCMAEKAVENSKDVNSQHLDKLAVSSYGPLPPEVIADFNSQRIAHTVSKCDSSSCTPGSSNPGAQNGAEDVRLYNAGQKVSSYSEGQYDTGKTACASDIAVQNGPLRLGVSQDVQPVLLDAIGGGISEEHGGNLKDSKDSISQDLAICQPMPTPACTSQNYSQEGSLQIAAAEYVSKLEKCLCFLEAQARDAAAAHDSNVDVYTGIIATCKKELEKARSRMNDSNSGGSRLPD